MATQLMPFLCLCEAAGTAEARAVFAAPAQGVEQRAALPDISSCSTIGSSAHACTHGARDEGRKLDAHILYPGERVVLVPRAHSLAALSPSGMAGNEEAPQ